MIACPKCGTENPDEARFCMSCGTVLAPAQAARELRKTVTVVFTDVTGSTSLGERLDPESMRRVMSRYFDEVRAVLERHGGTVEKFIGDAVMAVFGIPQLHEDDALRAVRAAWDMRGALDSLNERLQAELGVTIVTRTGVNTGEVVAGDTASGQSLVTGDAVNVAARLEQAAAPGEILIGSGTHRLVRDAVEAKALEPLAVKGKQDAVWAYRLTAVTAGAPGAARHLDSPMVGRERELDLLRWAFDRAVGERTCHLMTVLGAAGVGKSRLVEEFLARHAAEATVLRGRCLPYGEGITFWPIAEATKQAAGISDDDPPDSAFGKLEALVEGEERAELIHRRVAQVIGLAEDSAVPEETFWAIRSLFEAMARRRPLVLVLDDIHWAEPTLLDLIDHIADWSRDAPILLMCLARQELLELRPGWAGGKVNASTILLEPLTDQESEQLIGNLLGRSGLPGDALQRIEDAAEGNPLFVEEMVGMLIDDGLLRRANGDWIAAEGLATVAVPPTIQALLAARLDRLGGEERAVIEGASVVGRVFYRGAVTALTPDEVRPAVPGHLATLVRRELIRPDRSEFVGEDTYRFRHMLIRDSAYEALPKQDRAELHERFADWLEAAAGERVREYEEILAHHLEQAHAYLGELGLGGDRATDLAARAARSFISAGRRAEARGDVGGALKLLLRAMDLLPGDDPERVGILPRISRLLVPAGELARSAEVAEEAMERGARIGDRATEIQGKLARIIILVSTDPEMAFGEGRAEAERVLAEAQDTGDPATLARAWQVLGNLRFWAGDAAGGQAAGREGLAIAERAGLRDLTRELHWLEKSASVWGPVPVEEAIPWWEAVLGRDHDAQEELEANAALAVMWAMRGEKARALWYLDQAMRMLKDFGMKLTLNAAHPFAVVHLLLGDPGAAEAAVRPGIQVLQAMGESGFLSFSAALVAESVYRQGRFDEADEFTKLSEANVAEDDVDPQAAWRSVRAKVLARRGQFEEAERLAREAADIVRATDHSYPKGQVVFDLAEVLMLAANPDEALAAAGEALDLQDRKGDLASAARTKALIEQIERSG